MSATFSPCRTWRYSLSRDTRVVGAGGSVAFVGLNPSTADEHRDDPTIRRCVGFARRWGFARLHVVNLYAYCSTDPRGLRVVADAVGPENDAVVRQVVTNADLVVCAWGAGADPGRAAEVLDWIGAPHCLGRTNDGSPRQPLYVPAATDPVLLRTRGGGTGPRAGPTGCRHPQKVAMIVPVPGCDGSGP